jgi:ribonuclease J
MKEAEELVDGAKKLATKAIEAQIQRERWEWGVLRGGIHDSLSQYFWEKTRRRPMILPVIMQF